MLMVEGGVLGWEKPLYERLMEGHWNSSKTKATYQVTGTVKNLMAFCQKE